MSALRSIFIHDRQPLERSTISIASVIGPRAMMDGALSVGATPTQFDYPPNVSGTRFIKALHRQVRNE